MIRKTCKQLPITHEGISDPIVLCMDDLSLKLAKVYHWCTDEQPVWVTNCANAFAIDNNKILWWAYADEVRCLIEAE